MKKMISLLAAVTFVFSFSLFSIGCAAQKPMEKMESNMESMDKEATNKTMMEGEMKAPMKGDAPMDSMHSDGMKKKMDGMKMEGEKMEKKMEKKMEDAMDKGMEKMDKEKTM